MKNLKNVEVTDLVRIHVLEGMSTPQDRLPYQVIVEPIDDTQRVVFDDGALKVLNDRITDKVQQFENGRDPRVIKYIEEFVARMISELYRNGLMILEDLPESPEDPYAAVRHKVPIKQ